MESFYRREKSGQRRASGIQAGKRMALPAGRLDPMDRRQAPGERRGAAAMTKILIIDDSELVVGLIKDYLATHGFQVLIAMDANQGYQMAVENLPDLIILDVQ